MQDDLVTRRKTDVVRHFPPARASRETMAYLLDMSTDTFDRLASKGALPEPALFDGLRRWAVAATIATLDGVDCAAEPSVHAPSEAVTVVKSAPFLAGVEGLRGKAEGCRGAS